MKISVNTETEELEELRHAIAILEDALKRRENPDFYEEKPEEESPEFETEEPTQDSYESPPPPEPSQPSQESPQQPPSEVDMSSLTTSDYGEEKENRNMGNLTSPPPESQPTLDNKNLVKEIIFSLRNQNPGQPIQMQDIITKAQEKNISEDETRNLVSELQKEGSI